MAEASFDNPVTERSSIQLLDRYIEYAQSAIEKCRNLNYISGAQKLEKKCHSELKYLLSLSKRRGGFDDSNVRSSNLGHYLGVIHAAENLPDVTHILHAFSCPGRTEPLYADVVAGDGRVWVKVIARKAQALHLVWAGKGQYGERDISYQAEEYIVCSKEHPVNFIEPRIVFAFYNGVTADMAEEISQIGIEVLGNVVTVSEDVENMLKALDLSSTDSDESENEFCTEGNEFSCSELHVNSDSVSNSDQTKSEESHLFSDKNISTEENRRLKSMESRSGMSPYSWENIRLSSIVEFNQEVKNNSDGINDRVYTGSSGDKITSTIGSDVFPTTRQSGKSNNSHLKKSNSQSALQLPCLNEVYASEKQFQTEIDAVPLPEKDGKNNQNKYEPVYENVTNNADGELLMCPLIQFSSVSDLLAYSINSTTEHIRKVNLDVTSLITLVSAVTHGRCQFKFKEKVLTEQASEERRDPALSKLEQFLRGKELYACETSVQSFRSILDTLGGDGEVLRAEQLLQRVTIVPDNPSFRTQCLPNTGKIKDRSKIIFGTGDSLKAVTLTANSAFVRASKHQGCLYAAHIHPARALTEKKEVTGSLLEEVKDVNYHPKCELFPDICPDVK